METVVFREIINTEFAQPKDVVFSVGCNFLKCIQMQQSWTKSFIDILQSIQSGSPSTSLEDIYKKGLQDSHWEWPTKAMHLNSDEYIWFSVEVDSEIEAAIIVYHPTNSRIDSRQLFYVDYLAVAPWNRSSLVATPRFRGLGTKLLKLIGNYIRDTYNYPEGFSLHSLPQATSFYEHIGMVNLGVDAAKSGLLYLEMERQRAQEFYHG